MYILTRSASIESSKNNIYVTQDTVSEEQYLTAGYHRHERSYTIKEQNKDYTVVCPEFRSDAKGFSPAVIIPDFLIPGRPFPVYVYIYAIELYSTHPEKGQRWAAAETRKKFGLATFAHTTLGRALKAFVRRIEEDEPSVPKDGDVMAGTDTKPEPCVFPTVQKTAALRKKAAQFLRVNTPKAAGQETSAAYSALAKEYYEKYSRFLL